MPIEISEGKCWDITTVVAKSGFDPVPSWVDTALNFMPNRQEEVNIKQNLANYIREQS